MILIQNCLSAEQNWLLLSSLSRYEQRQNVEKEGKLYKKYIGLDDDQSFLKLNFLKIAIASKTYDFLHLI